MATTARRYVLASLGSAAVVSAAVAGIGLLESPSQHAVAASLVGAPPRGCRLTGTGADCIRPSGTAEPPAASSSPYRDGIYRAVGRYLTPGGDESIGVEVVLRRDLVVGSEVRVEAKSPTARQFQSQFASRYADRVTGRRITDLHLTRVAGASLTSLGFDEAVAQIEDAAHD